MKTYDVVLFLHIMAAVLGFGVAAVLHTMLFRLRSATDVRQVRDQMPVLKAAEPLFPLSAILLFGFGAYLIWLSDGDIEWGEGWIVTAIVALVVVEGVGGAVIGRRSKALHAAADTASDGPIDSSMRALLADRGIWVGAHFNTAVVAAIVFLMSVKPNGVGSVLTVVIGAALGVASALPFAKPVPATATARD
jgi:uncharacterized membrane protein